MEGCHTPSSEVSDLSYSSDEEEASLTLFALEEKRVLLELEEERIKPIKKSDPHSGFYLLCYVLVVIYLAWNCLTLVPKKEESSLIENTEANANISSSLPVSAANEVKKYLTLDYGAVAGKRTGFCNKLFELVAGVGIAHHLNRTPFIKATNPALVNFETVVQPIFPELGAQFNIIYWEIQEKIVTGFQTNSCCFYNSSLEGLSQDSAEYLHLEGGFYQSYKYFDQLRGEIRDWLTPNSTVQEKADANFPTKFKDHFIICAHIRRGDFQSDSWHAPSEANFSTLAMEYLIEKYKDKGKVAGIVLGNDPTWEKETFSLLNDTTIVQNDLEEEFAFTKKYCDVMLITAPSSTFGFFLGYLSKDFKVYYRDIMTTTDKGRSEMVQEDFFPPEWIKIREEDGKILEIASTG